MRFFGTLVAGAIGAVVITVALIVLFAAFDTPEDNGGSCRDTDAIALWGTYKACAEFQRSIGNDPNTGLPR